MDLDSYLREDRISGADFAAQLGMSEASLSRIRRGDQNITRETIRAIVAASGGKVTAEALVFHGIDDSGAALDGSLVTPAPAPASRGKAGESSPVACGLCERRWEDIGTRDCSEAGCPRRIAA